MPGQAFGVQSNLSALPYFYQVGLTGAADITVTGNGTYTNNDLMTLGSLPIGQYLCGAYVNLTQATNASTVTLKIWDGTTAYAASEFTLLATDDKTIAVHAFVLTLLAAATIKLSIASSNATTTTAKYTPTTSATGLTGLGSRMWAYRFA